ncbi:MAG: glycosyltransferase family 4 protein [Acidilobus sp.]
MTISLGRLAARTATGLLDELREPQERSFKRILLIAEVDPRIGWLRRGPQLRIRYRPPDVRYYVPGGLSRLYVAPPGYERLPPPEAVKSLLRQATRMLRPSLGKGFDLVHKFFIDLTRVAAPCVYESDQSMSQYFAGYLGIGKSLGSLLLRLRSLVTDGCGIVITWSSWAAKGFVMDGFNASSVYVIPPPMPTSVGRPHSGVNVLIVARDPFRKGLDVAVKAFMKASRGMDGSVKLIVVGPLSPFEDGHKILVMNHVSDKLMRNFLIPTADIVLAPSRAEAYNLTVLEAMAHGAVPVVTNVGGLPELVGDSGLVVMPGDYESMADALEELIYDDRLRTRLSSRAIELVGKRHNPEIVAEDLAKVYQKALEEGG